MPVLILYYMQSFHLRTQWFFYLEWDVEYIAYGACAYYFSSPIYLPTTELCLSCRKILIRINNMASGSEMSTEVWDIIKELAFHNSSLQKMGSSPQFYTPCCKINFLWYLSIIHKLSDILSFIFVNMLVHS